EIEVLQIGEEEPGVWFVKVKNSGVVTNLTFEKNGAKLASSAPPGSPQPGMPPPMAGAANPFTPPGGGMAGVNKSIPTRSLRIRTPSQPSVPAVTRCTPTPQASINPPPAITPPPAPPARSGSLAPQAAI